jgi:hypothetical protein
MTRSELCDAIHALWNEMNSSEVDRPPHEVVAWCEQHMGRWMAFSIVAREMESRHLRKLSDKIIACLKRIAKHQQSQITLIGETKPSLQKRLATLMARNNEVRAPLGWLRAEVMAETQLSTPKS